MAQKVRVYPYTFSVVGQSDVTRYLAHGDEVVRSFQTEEEAMDFAEKWGIAQ